VRFGAIQFQLRSSATECARQVAFACSARGIQQRHALPPWLLSQPPQQRCLRAQLAR
jgi:hypothetical protein